MTNWLETYRGAVPPWQCDVTEHFTVGYYFDRLEEADANLAEALATEAPGLADLPRRADVTRRITARFARELRAGASFHVESAALAVNGGLRLGHRFVESVSGEVVTWFDAAWDVTLTQAQSAAIAHRLGDWNGPAAEARPEPASLDGLIATARGRVKTADVDAAGHFALGAMVLRFSNASGQMAAAIGMDSAYMQSQRRGFSTFELVLSVTGMLALDAPYLIETGVAHLGNSSLRTIHRMTDARTGREVARLGQYGVNLDLDARRPARWPETIRQQAAGLMLG